MDYIEIMLRGYTNENSRKFLNKYFIREFRNAEKEHYEINEFFNGLVKGYKTLINQYQKQLDNRKSELYFMKHNADNDTKEYCNNELSSISLENYTINLLHFTNNKFIGHLYYNEVVFIGNEIAKAYKELNQPKQPEAINPDDKFKNIILKTTDEVDKHPKHDPNLWNSECFDLFKYLFDEYHKGTNRQLTNIWFYLKEYQSTKYVLKATKNEFIKFIKENYQIEIKNKDKAYSKYAEKEYPTMNDHRINFEGNLK